MVSSNLSIKQLCALALASCATAQISPVSGTEAKEGIPPHSNPQSPDTKIFDQYGHSPAVYPSPKIKGLGGWEQGLVKAKTFLEQLTLEEKAAMIDGVPGPCIGNTAPIPRINWPGFCLQDGPMGIRPASYASVFVSGVNAASTWNRTLMYERGNALGQEFKDKGAHVHLGPVAGPLGRNPYGGRNWEGFAADPYLTGVAMEETVHGIQDVGIQACPKHFIGNEQEIQRQPSHPPGYPKSLEYDTQVYQESVSANIDDRTMHELYLWPFSNSVRAGAATVMCSYNRLNGSYACQNSKTLNGLLKTELGFQGYVQSDWGATHSGLASIEAGLDMNQPGGFGMFGDIWTGSFFGANVTEAVKNGTLAMERLDDMVLRIMTPYYALGQDKNYPKPDESGVKLNDFSPPSTWRHNFTFSDTPFLDVRRKHAKMIRDHGAESIILLKNKGNALPLKAPKNIAVFGNDASDPSEGPDNFRNYEYGTLAAAGGSGTGHFTYLSTPLSAIRERSAQDGALVQSVLNNSLLAFDIEPRWDSWAPKTPDVCLVFVKEWHEELVERPSLGLDWHGEKVITNVADRCNNTVVITHTGGVNVLPWADHPNVTAILVAHYPGQESGHAAVDVLYGNTNPSAKLPYTIAYNESDYLATGTTSVNTTGPDDWQSYFDEKLEIDYRQFDAKNMSVRYEFGFGLSYTTFNMSNLRSECIAEGTITAAVEKDIVAPGGNPALWAPLYNVTVSVSNTGKRDGDAVSQLYVTFPDSTPAGTPPRQLRGFDKIAIPIGESRDASFVLMRRDLSYWDVDAQQWLIPSGKFTVSVGFSSRDLREVDVIEPISS
ncbi:hypothetical protein ACHAPT_009965 [Fusarium lateritium]